MRKADEKRQRPGLQRGFESLTQDNDTAKVAEVIKRLTGKSASAPASPENSSPVHSVESLPSSDQSRIKNTGVETTPVKISTPRNTPVIFARVETTPVKITPVYIETSYYKVPNDISDILAAYQTPAEQAVYNRLFRLSYGYNQNVCRVGMQALAKATNIASKKTIANAIAGLISKKHIRIVQEAHNDVRGTWYRIFLPSEIEGVRKISGAKITPVKSTPVEISAVNSTNNQGKNSAVENTPVYPSGEKTSREDSREKSSAVNFLSNTTDLLQTLSLSEIVDRFYQQLQQHPSQRKRERGVKEGEKLLQEGFTLEDLDYTVSWVLQKYPDTAAFDRVPFFIDQALKERHEKDRVREVEHQHRTEEMQQREAQQQTEEERQRIEEVKASFPVEKLEALQQEASQLVVQEHGQIHYGQEILIRLKVEELIRERFLGTCGS